MSDPLQSARVVCLQSNPLWGSALQTQAYLDFLGLPVLRPQLENVLGSAQVPLPALWTGNSPGSELEPA